MLAEELILEKKADCKILPLLTPSLLKTCSWQLMMTKMDSDEEGEEGDEEKMMKTVVVTAG